jgi:hypothetical protein
MVRSYNMSENEMGYRGSKSEIQSPQPNDISVKEQRVDGSYFGEKPRLRCTLTGLERGYQIKIPSKLLFRKFFSTVNLQNSLQSKRQEGQVNACFSPWFLTGFTDAEGCFTIKIQKNTELKTN